MLSPELEAAVNAYAKKRAEEYCEWLANENNLYIAGPIEPIPKPKKANPLKKIIAAALAVAVVFGIAYARYKVWRVVHPAAPRWAYILS